MNDAENLFFAGGSHARAAHAIVAAAQAHVHMAVPFYLLVGFSLETVLKAAYVHLGGDMTVARVSIRHDLPKALVFATARGFQSENESLGRLVESMADVHRNHSFRYLTGDGELGVPDKSCSVLILDDLVAQVGQMLYPQHNRTFWIKRLAQFESHKAEEGCDLRA